MGTSKATSVPTVENAAVIHATAQYRIGPQLSLSASIDTQLAPSYSSIGATGRLTYAW